MGQPFAGLLCPAMGGNQLMDGSVDLHMLAAASNVEFLSHQAERR